MKTYLCLLLTLICAGISFSQTDHSKHVKELDSLFTLLEETNKMMGTITISDHGKEIYKRHIGYATIRPELEKKPDDNTRYRIGSISKVYAAVMIMQLVEEGKLTLDTRLSKFYPSIYQSDSITIRQMLNHHSGLPAYASTLDLYKLLKLKTKNELITKISKEKGNWNDRQKGRYSNLNYMLLGFIIEDLTQSDFTTQLKLRITDKLDHTNTYNLQEYIEPSKNEANSFHFSDGKWTEDYEEKWLFTDASGQMVSTSSELAEFMDALFDGKLVKEESLKEMEKVQDRFGLGLHKADYDKSPGFAHTGRIDGFVSALSHLPEKELTTAIIINGQVYPINDILVIVLDILHDKPYEFPLLKKVELSPEKLKRFEGKYYSELAKYKGKIKTENNVLTIQIKPEGKLFYNVVTCSPVSETRFMNDTQGIILDFQQDKLSGKWNLVMRVSGSKLPFVQE